MNTDSDSFLGAILGADEFTGQLKIIEEIHTSSTGHCRVFIAEKSGKRIIVKALKEEYADDPQFQLMLRKEYLIGFSLSHPGIVHILEYADIVDIGECIVEEYIDGTELNKYIESDNVLLYEDAVEILKKIVDAVGYIHKRKIVHGDLKPTNILISEFDRTPVIIDFGFADSSDYKSLKFIGGTTSYIAPERLSTDYKIDLRSDIWSLGIIIEQFASKFKGSERKNLERIATKCKKPIHERVQDTLELSELLSKPRKLRSIKKMLNPIILLLIIIIGAVGYTFLKEPKNIADIKTSANAMLENDSSNNLTLTATSNSAFEQNNNLSILDNKGNSVNSESHKNNNYNQYENISADEISISDNCDIEKAMSYAEDYTKESLTSLKKNSFYKSNPTFGEYFNIKQLQNQILRDIEYYIDRMQLSDESSREIIKKDAISRARKIIADENERMGFVEPPLNKDGKINSPL